LTIAEQRQREAALLKKMENEKSSLEEKTRLIGFLSSTPDYEKTLDKYGKSLPLKLRTFLAKHPNDPDAMAAAYEACKDSSTYMKEHSSVKQHDNAKRAAENMSKPGSGSSTGSGGSVSLSNKLKSMTRAERIAWSDKCIREGGR
jgi:NAD(P)H-nitrite reductase large subunit